MILSHARPIWCDRRGRIDLDVLARVAGRGLTVDVAPGLAKLAVGRAVDELLTHCDVPRARRGHQAIVYVARAALRELAGGDDGGRQLGMFGLDAHGCSELQLAGDELDALDETEAEAGAQLEDEAGSA